MTIHSLTFPWFVVVILHPDDPCEIFFCPLSLILCQLHLCAVFSPPFASWYQSLPFPAVARTPSK